MGTKIVTRTRKTRKKLNPRSSTQKGNSGFSIRFGIVRFFVVTSLSNKLSSRVVVFTLFISHRNHGRSTSTSTLDQLTSDQVPDQTVSPRHWHFLLPIT